MGTDGGVMQSPKPATYKLVYDLQGKAMLSSVQAFSVEHAIAKLPAGAKVIKSEFRGKVKWHNPWGFKAQDFKVFKQD